MKNVMNCLQLPLCEKKIPFQGDPLLCAALFADSGLADEYLVYEKGGEWFLGFGVAALLRFNAETTTLQAGGQSFSWKSGPAADSVHQALQFLPMEKWRAYGIAHFELARHTYRLAPATPAQDLLHLFVPAFEVHLQDNWATLRAMDGVPFLQLATLFQDIQQEILRESGRAQRLAHLEERIRDRRLAVPDMRTCNTGAYGRAVTEAVREIAARRYKKVILSRSIPLPRPIDMVATYVAGRRANTPARSYLLKLDGLEACGFSPETVLEADADGWVSTRPLAGTRALGDSQEEERRLRDDLLNDTKEVHEHAVSVQLAFAELGGVCRQGSVCVNDFMSVSRRNSVQHLASRLKGHLRNGYSAWHAFDALFPAVTATGIPKKESIEAIARMEPGPRGLYAGCVMLADHTGALDAALVLRSVYQQGNRAWMQVGAGIVEKSTPEREIEETCEKISSVSRYLVHA
ncbi:salicylate synthase [Desulfobulbus elongatus]|uniref:salicylate synthase n=1 Tax=Desulfobulbus elongatus TaxID=53332 RepID=UPI000A3DACE4|nr:salicylate synthase [Desulfobulbus elongatus]